MVNVNFSRTLQMKKINERFLEKIFSYIDIPADKFSLIGVTGGKSSDLSDEYHNVKVLKVNDKQKNE